MIKHSNIFKKDEVWPVHASPLRVGCSNIEKAELCHCGFQFAPEVTGVVLLDIMCVCYCKQKIKLPNIALCMLKGPMQSTLMGTVEAIGLLGALKHQQLRSLWLDISIRSHLLPKGIIIKLCCCFILLLHNIIIRLMLGCLSSQCLATHLLQINNFVIHWFHEDQIRRTADNCRGRGLSGGTMNVLRAYLLREWPSFHNPQLNWCLRPFVRWLCLVIRTAGPQKLLDDV